MKIFLDGDEKDDQKGKPKSLGHWFGKPGKNSDKLPRQAVAGTTVQNSGKLSGLNIGQWRQV